jgi:S1-C subfamily serine protease
VPLELRILSGARAGFSASFDKSVIAVGRHATSDLRLDPNSDLDVSTRHAEIHEFDGEYTVHDRESTNGTFVNDVRLERGGARELNDGDVMMFGANGPRVAAHVISPEDMRRGPASMPAHKIRLGTAERIAIAVREQTQRMRLLLIGGGITLGGLAVGGWWMGHREAVDRDAEIKRLIAANEQSAAQFQKRLESTNDSGLINELARRNDSLRRRLQEGASSGGNVSALRSDLARANELQRTFAQMDLPAIRAANNAAIVLVTTYVDGKGFESTGFSVSPTGMLVTSRHAVMKGTTRASKILVRFADSPESHPAHIVRVSSGRDGQGNPIDLALLQIDDAGTYPTLGATVLEADVPVGSPIATLGFPLGTSVPMDNSGKSLIAKTTLTTGMISKVVPDLLQVDSFAGQGSSGSPVFDAHGHLVGAVWGGPVEARGRIVYAVGAARIRELIGK